jgi:hypothetical protein
VPQSLPGTITKPPSSVAEACQWMCDRLAQIDCMRPTCVGDCQRAVVLPVCSPSYIAFLSCALASPFTCDSGVADLGGLCANEKATFVACRMGTPTMPMPGMPVVEPPPPMTPVDDGGRTTACPEIPPLDPSATCTSSQDDAGTDAGDEADAGDAGADDAAELPPREQWPKCWRSCAVGLGKPWSAQCSDGKCICSYAGGQQCTCAQRMYECNVDCCF